MKTPADNIKITILFLVLLVIGGCQSIADNAGEHLRVMSFNIRYDNPDDGINQWTNRKDWVASLVRFHQTDLLGVQEALIGQMNDLQTRLPAFAWVGVGREDGREEGEFSAIFYRKSRLNLMESGNFWLSENPDSAGSLGWDAACVRIVTWARFRDGVSGKKFLYLNTHFDHRGPIAREQSARLLVEKARALAANDPVIITGDFNAGESSVVYRTITSEENSPHLNDAYYVSAIPSHGPNDTFNGFGRDDRPDRIDFIFISDDIDVHRHGILSESYGGRYPSDHMPVLAELGF